PKDIKKCRLLSKLWAMGAQRVLRKKTYIKFNVQFVPEDIDRNNQYLEEMKHFGAPHNILININLPKNVPRDPFESLESREYGNNHTFFTNYIQAQRIKIAGTIYNASELRFVEDLLQNSAPILSELELNLHSYPHLYRERFCQKKA